jgi:hypothetical protein
MGLGDFRQRDDIGTAAHDRGEIVHPVLIERIDAHRDHVACFTP